MPGGGEHLKDEVRLKGTLFLARQLLIYDVGFETAGDDSRGCCRARVKVNISWKDSLIQTAHGHEDSA